MKDCVVNRGGGGGGIQVLRNAVVVGVTTLCVRSNVITVTRAWGGGGPISRKKLRNAYTCMIDLCVIGEGGGGQRNTEHQMC